MLNLTITANESFGNESLTEFYQTPPSLAISEHSLVKGTPQHIREWLMSSQVDSRANHSASPESKPEPTIPATCGPQLSNACASYDRNTRSWKMSQGWLLADILAPSWETWQKAGLIVGGEYFQQPSWERRINEIGCGLLPTPTVGMATGGQNPENGGQIGLGYMARKGLWPTPTARDYRTGMTNRVDSRKEAGLPVDLNDQVGGQLSPDWVEWLMSWPIGWTSLDPLPQSAVDEWADKVRSGEWWANEPDIPRVAQGVPNRTHRLKATGNGQVSPVVASAWNLLTEDMVG